MPFEMAMEGHLSRRQFHARAQEAVERIQSDAFRIEQLEAALRVARKDMAQVGSYEHEIDHHSHDKAIAIVDALLDPSNGSNN